MGSQSRTPYTILGCLTLEPMSGYDVRKFLERSIVHFWGESYGQIYPALEDLEDEGLVESRQEPGERGRPKRVYRITEAGREELRHWLERPAEPVTPRYEHSLKLFFGHNVGPEVSLGHVRRLREEASRSLASYREWEERLQREAEEAPGSHAPYWLVVLRGGIRYAEMVRAWCDETEEALRELPEPAPAGGGTPAPAGKGDAG